MNDFQLGIDSESRQIPRVNEGILFELVGGFVDGEERLREFGDVLLNSLNLLVREQLLLLLNQVVVLEDQDLGLEIFEFDANQSLQLSQLEMEVLDEIIDRRDLEVPELLGLSIESNLQLLDLLEVFLKSVGLEVLLQLLVASSLL